MPLATDARPAQLPLPGGRRGATVKVHPIVTGYLHAPPAHLDRPGGVLAPIRLVSQLLPPRRRWRWLPVPAFLVEHPEAGAVLIDTGLHPSCATDVAGNMGRAGKILYRVRMEHDQSLRSELPRRGVQPADVRVVVITHLHIDHASAVSEFPNATFLLDAHEWAAAADGGWRRGYHTRQFDHAFDWRMLDYGSDAVQSFAGFARTVDLLGDGSVRLVSTPGHTPGHQSVVVRTAGRELLILGDAAYTRQELEGGTTPFVIADEHLWRRSQKEIRRYLAQTPGALAIPSHDPDLWSDLAPLYE
jgi:glyoxylase-like metal-dependent hydrolase (beta-lactamase superfamily II)